MVTPLRRRLRSRAAEHEPNVGRLPRARQVPSPETIDRHPPKALIADARDAGEPQPPGHFRRLLVSQLGQPRLAVAGQLDRPWSTSAPRLGFADPLSTGDEAGEILQRFPAVAPPPRRDATPPDMLVRCVRNRS
jgi:hypothetical protein